MAGRLSGLEAVRGVAALMVAWEHAGMFGGYRTPASALYDMGFLAVDLFFLLSGFVLARTYEHRMPGAVTFLCKRFARLWLPVAAGVMLGACYYALVGTPADEMALHLALGLAILPLVGGAIMFNPPAWSIFFELFANFAHALALKRLSNKALGGIVALCAAVLMGSMDAKGINVGFNEYWWMGIPRVIMSYALGILIWRLNGDRAMVPGGVVWPMMAVYALVVALFPHWLGGGAQLAFVLLVNPLVLLASLGMKDSRAAVMLGAYSFPLYALHYPAQMLASSAGADWAGALVASLAISLGIGLLIDPRFRAALALPEIRAKRAAV